LYLRATRFFERPLHAEDLATALLEGGPLPEKVAVDALQIAISAAVDALHIAISAIEEIEYLLTWNCTHIANAAIR
jgi:coenzyme F420-reducing hydrogenase beta subunit